MPKFKLDIKKARSDEAKRVPEKPPLFKTDKQPVDKQVTIPSLDGGRKVLKRKAKEPKKYQCMSLVDQDNSDQTNYEKMMDH